MTARLLRPKTCSPEHAREAVQSKVSPGLTTACAVSVNCVRHVGFIAKLDKCVDAYAFQSNFVEKGRLLPNDNKILPRHPPSLGGCRVAVALSSTSFGSMRKRCLAKTDSSDEEANRRFSVNDHPFSSCCFAGDARKTRCCRHPTGQSSAKTRSLSSNRRADCNNWLQFEELKHNDRVRVSPFVQVR